MCCKCCALLSHAAFVNALGGVGQVTIGPGPNAQSLQGFCCVEKTALPACLE